MSIAGETACATNGKSFACIGGACFSSMSFSFREGEHPALIVGQDGILRAGWQPALVGLFTKASGGLTTRRRLPTCPTTSAEFPFARKLNDIVL